MSAEFFNSKNISTRRGLCKLPDIMPAAIDDGDEVESRVVKRQRVEDVHKAESRLSRRPGTSRLFAPYRV